MKDSGSGNIIIPTLFDLLRASLPEHSPRYVAITKCNMKNRLIQHYPNNWKRIFRSLDCTVLALTWDGPHFVSISV